MTEFEFSPKTKPVPARLLRVGQIVLESPEHPARITRVTAGVRLWVYARYIWQRETEAEWILGRFRDEDTVERAI
jgi:hypothetical protein